MNIWHRCPYWILKYLRIPTYSIGRDTNFHANRIRDQFKTNIAQQRAHVLSKISTHNAFHPNRAREINFDNNSLLTMKSAPTYLGRSIWMMNYSKCDHILEVWVRWS